MTTDFILFYDPLDLGSRIVRTALYEFDVEFTGVALSTSMSVRHLTPAFVRQNPTLQFPALIKTGATITELAGIETAILEGRNQTAVLGKLEDWLADHSGLHIEALTLGLSGLLAKQVNRWFLKQQVRTLHSLAKQEDDLAPHYTQIRKQLLHRLDAYPSRDTIEACLRNVDERFNRFESHISNRRFVFENRWTMADAIWGSGIAALRSLQLRDLADGKRHPHTTAYFRRMSTRASFRRAAPNAPAAPYIILRKLLAGALAPIALKTHAGPLTHPPHRKDDGAQAPVPQSTQTFNNPELNS